MEAETETEVRAAEDQALQAKDHATKILQTETATADYAKSLTRQ